MRPVYSSSRPIPTSAHRTPPRRPGPTGLRTAASLAVLGLALLVVLPGCVLSVDPIVPAAAAAFDARLLGTWEAVSGTDRAVITRIGEDGYGITYTSNDQVNRFEARLGRLGNHQILDVWPTTEAGDAWSSQNGLLIAGHLLFTLDAGPDTIRLAALDADTLARALQAGQVHLTAGRADDRMILFDETETLRAELAAYLSRPGVLTDPVVYRRAAPGDGGAQAGPVEPACFEAAAWREADRLFHRDPHWLGGDVASTVDLGDGRIFWLFGDTWIDPSGRGSRRGARMVSNTVAIQTGLDPSTASISFYRGQASDGGPGAFFPDRGDLALWPGNGVRVGDRLVLFFALTRRTGTGLGFEHAGWTAVLVENPDAEPASWRVRPLQTPTNTLGILVGFAAVLRVDDHVYALGSQNPVKSHPIYAARWPADALQRGDLHHPEWWAGAPNGWVPDSSDTPRWPLFENGQAELTVHVDPATRTFVETQTQGFGPADVIMRAAPTLTGPWSAPRLVYRPPEYHRPNVMIYAGKAHPHLDGADLVLTYATNTFRFDEHLSDSLIYYPRFVQLTRCR